MTPRLRPVPTATVVVGAALLAAPALAGPAYAAPRIDRDTSVYAVNGTDSHLYARYTTSPRYYGLGGVLRDAPAVVPDLTRNFTYYIVRGTDNELYVRTEARTWQRMTRGAYCREPAAATSGDMLAVACRGSDNRLYVGKTTLSATGLPTIARFTDLGGVLTAGPGIVGLDDANNTFSYGAVGIGGRLYVRADGEPTYTRTELFCGDSVTLANSTTAAVISCPSKPTRSLQVIEATTEQTSAAVDAGGVVLGRPGIAIRAGNAVDAWVAGTTKGIYHTVVTPSSNGTGTVTPYVREPGAAMPGVGAAHFSPETSNARERVAKLFRMLRTNPLR